MVTKQFHFNKDSFTLHVWTRWLFLQLYIIIFNVCWIKSIVFGALLRVSWGVSQPERRSCSVVNNRYNNCLIMLHFLLTLLLCYSLSCCCFIILMIMLTGNVENFSLSSTNLLLLSNKICYLQIIMWPVVKNVDITKTNVLCSTRGREVTHYCNLKLFPVTKVRDYNCQNSNYITVADPSNAALLRY